VRVAALYDIHGNLPALEAVLREVRAADVDRIVVGGDVLPGPMPRESLALLAEQTIPISFLYGNGERAVVDSLRGQDSSQVPQAARESVRWSALQLTPAQRQDVAAWPATQRFEVEGLGPVLFCHATPRNDWEIFTALTPLDRVAFAFEGVGEGVVLCGHTHMQFQRQVGAIRVVNAGSVGMPFGDPGAYWGLLGPGVELRCTRYNGARAVERICATEYPDAAGFAHTSIVEPASVAEMCAAFERSALGGAARDRTE